MTYSTKEELERWLDLMDCKMGNHKCVAVDENGKTVYRCIVCKRKIDVEEEETKGEKIFGMVKRDG